MSGPQKDESTEEFGILGHHMKSRLLRWTRHVDQKGKEMHTEFCWGEYGGRRLLEGGT